MERARRAVHIRADAERVSLGRVVRLAQQLFLPPGCFCRPAQVKPAPPRPFPGHCSCLARLAQERSGSWSLQRMRARFASDDTWAPGCACRGLQMRGQKYRSKQQACTRSERAHVCAGRRHRRVCSSARGSSWQKSARSRRALGFSACSAAAARSAARSPADPHLFSTRTSANSTWRAHVASHHACTRGVMRSVAYPSVQVTWSCAHKIQALSSCGISVKREEPCGARLVCKKACYRSCIACSSGQLAVRQALLPRHQVCKARGVHHRHLCRPRRQLDLNAVSSAASQMCASPCWALEMVTVIGTECGITACGLSSHRLGWCEIELQFMKYGTTCVQSCNHLCEGAATIKLGTVGCRRQDSLPWRRWRRSR